MTTGVLLVQVGTPASPEPADVRRYLAQFLSDPRVLSMPAPARWLLLHGVILRVRPRRSAAAYREIWTDAGSPLLVHSRALAGALADELGPGFRVELAMRYGQPDLSGALERLAEAEVSELRALALFPQYAEATSGSIRSRVGDLVSQFPSLPDITWLPPFYNEPAFVGALATACGEVLDAFQPDHLLLSYHGLPESQVRGSGGPACKVDAHCCDAPESAGAGCYRAQCYATSRALLGALGFPPERATTAFQSRVGLNRWIGPFTDETFEVLAARGVKRLAVACPAFVADCLETLEEIGLRGRARWLELGGDDLALIPCVNARPDFVTAVAGWLRSPQTGGSEAAARTPEASESPTDTPSR